MYFVINTYFHIDVRLLNDTIMAMTHKYRYFVLLSFGIVMLSGNCECGLYAEVVYDYYTLYKRLPDSLFTARCFWREICRCYLISRRASDNLEYELINNAALLQDV